MKKKTPIGYYIYVIVAIILTFIFWKYFDNSFIVSLLSGLFFSIPTTYIIVIIHILIENMK